MISNLEIFLNSLDDYELATFYKYRFEDFLTKSKQKILSEFASRNITIDNVEFIISKYKTEYKQRASKSDTYVCPRCFSSKSFVEKEEIQVVHSPSGYTKEKYIRQCRICKYSPDR